MGTWRNSALGEAAVICLINGNFLLSVVRTVCLLIDDSDIAHNWTLHESGSLHAILGKHSSRNSIDHVAWIGMAFVAIDGVVLG